MNWEKKVHRTEYSSCAVHKVPFSLHFNWPRHSRVKHDITHMKIADEISREFFFSPGLVKPWLTCKKEQWIISFWTLFQPAYQVIRLRQLDRRGFYGWPYYFLHS